MTASTLLGRLSTRCWNIAAGTCFHSATRTLVRLGTDVGRLGLARSRCSNSSQRCSMGLRSGLCAGQSRFFTPISTNQTNLAGGPEKLHYASGHYRFIMGCRIAVWCCSEFGEQLDMGHTHTHSLRSPGS
jgi:hypothetical protein